MTDEELILMFRYSNGKLCGRFAKSQLDRPLRMLPEKTTPAGWWRTLLLLPLTLFAKPSTAQNLHEMMHTALQEANDTELVEQMPVDSNAVAVQSDSAQEQQPMVAVTFPDSLITFKDWPQIEYVVGIPPMVDWSRQIYVEPMPVWYIIPHYDPAPESFTPVEQPSRSVLLASLFYSITDSTVFTRRKRKANAVQLENAVASDDKKEQPEQQQRPVSPALSADEVTLPWWRRKFRV